jgi:TRAP-type C4-dicarboxylate transport system permease small subunit
MRKFAAGLLKAVHWLEEAFLVSLLLTMIVLAVMQIVLRNGFDGGFLWVESFLRVLVLWIALAGALLASRKQQHISKYLPPAAARAAAVFNGLFTAGICFLLAWYALEFVKIEFESPSPAFANVPTWLCESIMPVAFALIGLRYLRFAVQALRQPLSARAQESAP